MNTPQEPQAVRPARLDDKRVRRDPPNTRSSGHPAGRARRPVGRGDALVDEALGMLAYFADP